MVDIVGITLQFFEWSQSIAESYGYLGIFLVSFIGSASIIFPIPATFVIFIFGGILNPWIVGLVAGIGAAIGELTGYAIGFAGRKAAKKKYKKWLIKSRKWAEKRGAFLVILIFAATPLPDDIVGILAGIIKYDIKKFLLATLIGKTIMCLAIAWGGFYGINLVLGLFGGV